jgi:hypothetical protein
MCHFNEVLGSGGVLALQLLTIASIGLSIAFWVFLYRREKVGLGRYAFPIALWICFGTLDIVITARGTAGNPALEGNPLARLVFTEAGWAGPVLASILWIALWAGLVLLANKRLAAPAAAFFSLAVFYSLAAGHLLGFSSWFAPLCEVSRVSWLLLSGWPVRLAGTVLIGCLIAWAHGIVLAGKFP